VSSHPSRDSLAAAAAGDPEARRSLAPHLATCAACRGELARLFGILDAATDELVRSRPGCPSPELLAELPPGAEETDPHVRSCPLCQEELRLLRHLETARALEHGLAAGGLRRPKVTMRSELPRAAAAPGAVARLELREGARAETTVAGVTVRLAVAGGELVVELEGEPGALLELLLENDLLQRKVSLAVGRTVLPVGSFTRATVRRRESGGA